MAKIPFLHGQKRADGSTAWHWKPSPRLRKVGWTNQFLGQGPGRQPPREVLDKALDLNRKLEEWDRGAAAVVATAKPAPRKWLFSDLVDAYRASSAYREDIAASTRREYDSRIRQLMFWAQDGALPIRQIDSDMVLELKNALLENGGSKFKCAAMLRVLRILMRWAAAPGRKLIPEDPTSGVAIPTPPSRRQMLAWRDLQDIAALPGADPTGVRALRYGFWTMQRREDLRLINRFQWRELHGADPRDLPALVNAKGQVWGFRLTQEKTGATVDCPMPPFLHAEIEAAFAESQWLFPHSQDPAKAISGDVIRRRAKPLLIAFDLQPLEPEALQAEIVPMLLEQGIAGGDPHKAILGVLCGDHRDDEPMQLFREALLERLKAIGFRDHQLRDMRRSGMSWVKDMGAEKSDVFAISGHPLDGQQKTMADVYMPPNTKAACRAIAAACRTLAAIEAREKEEAK